MAYADDVNPLGDNIDTVKKSTDTLTDASKEADLDIDVEKTKLFCCPISCVMIYGCEIKLN
jgi:hypothetical protein